MEIVKTFADATLQVGFVAGIHYIIRSESFYKDRKFLSVLCICLILINFISKLYL